MNPALTPERLAALVRWFEGLSPATVAQVAEWYAADAHFTDPFNEVTGAAAVQRIYAHMFEQVREPRFQVTACYPGSDSAMLAWEFRFTPAGGAPVMVPGASELHFDRDGRIARHVDYWDPSRAIYGRVPLLGTLLGWVRRRIATP